MLDLEYRRILTNLNRFNLYELYANEKMFSNIFSFAYKYKDSEDNQLSKICIRFINVSLFLLINKPSDLMILSRNIPKKQVSDFLEFIIRHEYTNPNIYIFLGCDLDLVLEFPFGSWIEVPITQYCSHLINNHDKLYSIYELLPLYDIATDDLKEYVFSVAYESNKLDESSVILFERNFPKKFHLLKNSY